MGVNIYYLELIFILINFDQQKRLIKRVILLKKKDKKHQKKNLVVNLLELLQVMQKMVMIQIKFKNKKIRKTINIEKEIKVESRKWK